MEKNENIAYLEGREFFINSQYRKAIDKFQIAHKEDPLNLQYLYAIGHNQNLLGDYETSIKYLNKVLSKDEKHIKSKIIKINSLLCSNKISEALELSDKAINMHNNGIFNASKALVLQQMDKKKSEIIQNIDEALKINNKEPYIWYLKGSIEYNGLEWENALDSFDKALSYSESICSLDEDVFVSKIGILFGKLDVYYYINNTEDAFECVKEIIRYSPKNLMALNFKASIYYKEGDYDNALFVLNRALDIDPDNTSCLNFKGIIFDITGSPNTALRVYERVLKIDPDYEDTITNISILYFYQKKYQKALEVAKKALAKNPKSPYALYWGSRAARKLKNYSLARRLEKKLNDPEINLIFLEKNLQDKIVNDPWRLKKCGYNYKLKEREYTLKDGSGRLDLLYEDKNTGDYVVVELKIVNASKDTYEQIIKYMNSVRNTIGRNRKIKGLVIATGQDDNFKELIEKNKDISYLDYYRLGLG